MKIGIVGYGSVGKQIRSLFARHYRVSHWDKELLGCNSETLREAVNQSDVGFVCVPTPSHPETGRCDTSIVEEVVDWLETPLIVIKSTVEPGTTDRLIQRTGKRIVYSPEYVGESSYCPVYRWEQDMEAAPWYTFGGDPRDTRECVELYQRVLGPGRIYHQTDAVTAELAKYASNVFFAMKVAYCYELAEICRSAGVDYHKLRETWLMDPRVGDHHTAVFADNDHPFGGKCLPKDTLAFAAYANELGLPSVLIRAILASNEEVGKARKALRSLENSDPR